jgi:galactofuranosylgalactofuranosylrhamnosyl-N-acetylglucosaminyl-diphospho-decaprenol beta-1,5/1,6-galactofuranosyltransferase
MTGGTSVTLLGTLRLPPSADVVGLFLSFGWPSTLRFHEAGIVLNGNETVSTNTYFNSFFEAHYARYTSLGNVYYELRLAGDFVVSLHRRRSPTNQECLERSTHLGLRADQPLRLSLPRLGECQKPGRIYLEITSLKDGGIFCGGELLTDELPPHEVALGIITCTYKKNAYVKRTVDAITSEPGLLGERLGVFVVDNGRDLPAETFADSRVQVIPNDNVGGSGGFNRGLLAAASSDKRFTHFLMMDDDIVLCSEVLLRLVGILKFARTDLVISGSMLPRERPHFLFEAGGLYGMHGDRSGPRPLGWAAIKHGLYLQDADALDKLRLEERPDYGALWFLAFSREVLREKGYLMPFFIKVDDIEYGLRISASDEHPVVAFPSIAVWHDAFEKKKPPWEVYYCVRNALACSALHRPGDLKATLRRVSEKFLSRLLVFDYGVAELHLMAVEHYLQGPQFLVSESPTRLHAQVTQIAGASRTITWDDEESERAIADGGYLSRVTTFRQRLLALATLGGHLLPKALLDDGRIVTLTDNPHQRLQVFPHTHVRLFMPDHGFLHRAMDQRRGLALIWRWLAVMLKLAREWDKVAQTWRDEAPRMVTEAFWREYFHLPDGDSSREQ